METVPSVLHILCRHADDPNEAIVRAVNDTWDNDSVAAIVGAVVGALHGASRIEETTTTCSTCWRRPGRLGGTDACWLVSHWIPTAMPCRPSSRML